MAASQHPSKKLLAVCTILSLSCNLQYAFSTTYPNSAGEAIKSSFNSSHHGLPFGFTLNFYWDILLNLWFVGFLAGLWVARWLTDSVGRKEVSPKCAMCSCTTFNVTARERAFRYSNNLVAFQVGNIFNILGCALRLTAIYILDPTLLMIARIICATATGCAYQCLILYLQEAPPTSSKGVCSYLNGITFSAVCVLGLTLGNDHVLGKHLPELMMIPLMICTTLFLALAPIPDTPKYLMLKEKRLDARKAVEFFHGENSDVDSTLKLIEQEALLNQHINISFVDIFRERHLRKALILSVAALQGTVALWPIMMSSSFFLKKVDLSPPVAQWCSTAMASAYFMGTISSALLIERCGRRFLLINSNILNITCLVMYTICAQLHHHSSIFKYLCLVAFVAYGFTYGAGVGPIGRFISTELTPVQYRSAMCAVTYSFNTVMNAVTSFAFLPLFDVVGSYAFIILYAIPSALCVILLALKLPETKGREISDIVMLLEKF